MSVLMPTGAKYSSAEHRSALAPISNELVREHVKEVLRKRVEKRATSRDGSREQRDPRVSLAIDE